MLNWTMFILFAAVVAGILGFSGIAGAATVFAQALFLVCLGLFAVTALVFGRRVTTTPRL